jgi:hypothetical protein
MWKPIAALTLLTLTVPSAAQAQAAPPAAAEAGRDAQLIKNARSDRSVARTLLFYLPNRIFDITDLLRVRVRVGPGLAARARVTEAVDAGLGSYAALYVGLPGPRQNVQLPLPLGLESYTGAELGPAEAELQGGAAPVYSSTEVGVSVQALVSGLDVGADPFELLDFAAGLVLFDLRADDY